jgi:hypothetical protein
VKEACFSAEDIDALLSSMGEGDILVGGQSLAFWVGYYGIKFKLPADVAAISMDGDVLGTKGTARRIASGMGGRVNPAPKEATTILVAQVTIELENQSFLNVDIIDRVNGLPNEEIHKRALPVAREKQSFLVMHPVDVFVSRVRNILSIPSKQDEKGRLQLQLGTLVARRFIEDIASRDQVLATKAANMVFNEFRENGKEILARWGVDLFDAIPIDDIVIPAFVEHQRSRMIAEHDSLIASARGASARGKSRLTGKC